MFNKTSITNKNSPKKNTLKNSESTSRSEPTVKLSGNKRKREPSNDEKTISEFSPDVIDKKKIKNKALSLSNIPKIGHRSGQQSNFINIKRNSRRGRRGALKKETKYPDSVDKLIKLDQNPEIYELDLEEIFLPPINKTRQKLEINQVNFNNIFKDTEHNFLISMAKCFEIHDACASCTFHNGKFFISFNSVGLKSHENIQIKSTKLLYSIFKNYEFKSKNDYENENLIKIIIILLKHHCQGFRLDFQLTTNQEFINYVTSYMYELESGKELSRKLNIGLDDDDCDSAMRNFSVCFRRVITSKIFEKWKKSEFIILLAGTIENHAEIKLVRHLMKNNLFDALTDNYIGISKRPCIECNEIINNFLNKKLEYPFIIRNPSKFSLKNYHYPEFLDTQYPKAKEKIKDDISNAEKKSEKEYYSMNVSTSFDLKSLLENLPVSQTISPTITMGDRNRDNIKNIKNIKK